MLIKLLLLISVVLAVTGMVLYVYYSVNANRFAFTLAFTALLAVPLIYHLIVGDAEQLTPFKLILMAYIPVTFFWYRLDLLRKTKEVQDDEELL